MRLALCLLLCATGCQAGGGAMVGLGRGGVSTGWEAGVGNAVEYASHHLDVGQRWAADGQFTYGAGTFAYTDAFDPAGPNPGGALSFGVGGGGGHASLLVGAGGYGSRPYLVSGQHGFYVVPSMIVGVRWIARAFELYVAPRVDVAWMPE